MRSGHRTDSLRQSRWCLLLASPTPSPPRSGSRPPAACSGGGEGAGGHGRAAGTRRGREETVLVERTGAVPLPLTSASRNGPGVKAGLAPSVAPPWSSHFNFTNVPD